MGSNPIGSTKRIAMRHFVQYHNADKRGPYVAPESGFRVVTDRPVESIVGDRVWLVTASDAPRKYFLCATFIVDKIGPATIGPQQNCALGSSGQALDVRIDQLPWFSDLKRATGNFAFGLQHVKSASVIDGLIRLIET